MLSIYVNVSGYLEPRFITLLEDGQICFDLGDVEWFGWQGEPKYQRRLRSMKESLESQSIQYIRYTKGARAYIQFDYNGFSVNEEDVMKYTEKALGIQVRKCLF